MEFDHVTVGSFYSGSVAAREKGKPVVTMENGAQATIEEGELTAKGPESESTSPSPNVVGLCEGLCVIADNQATLDTVAEQVRKVAHPHPELITNRKDIDALPTYSHIICCVRKSDRNISYDIDGKLEPDADLGFRAFHKMEKRFQNPKGVILILFDHANHNGTSTGTYLPPRLQELANTSRFLIVNGELSTEQEQMLQTWVITDFQQRGH
ncbi:hypothetical protein Bbelb_217510 [Branchiostoma belcheri]|nr:hypothetical protein Bbelb_217510 [Branchiostoma belcheri]